MDLEARDTGSGCGSPTFPARTRLGRGGVVDATFYWPDAGIGRAASVHVRVVGA